MSLARATLRVAIRAARRWPPGRPVKAWFLRDALEPLSHQPEFSVDAGRAGDPAVCVAAFRAHRAGREVVRWRDVFMAQAQLIELLRHLGVEDYNQTLSEDPALIADLLEGLLEDADGVRDGDAVRSGDASCPVAP